MDLCKYAPAGRKDEKYGSIKAYTSRLKNDVLTIDKEIGINFKGD